MTSQKVDVAALEETMGEVVEALDLTGQAAEFVQSHSPNATDRRRAAAVRRQAEAMLDAAEQASEDDFNDTGEAPDRVGRDTRNGALH